MRYVLDKAFDAGRFRIAVVSQQSVTGHQSRAHGIALTGRKQPVFVVVRDGEGRQVHDMTGAKVPLETVAALCPAVAKV